MFYLALGITISLSNICTPFQCLTQLFCWDVNKVLLHEKVETNDVPKTVKEMRKLIKDMKAPPMSP